MIQGLQEPMDWWSAVGDFLKGRDSMCWFICRCADRGARAPRSLQLSITSSILQVNMLQTTEIREKLLPQMHSGPKCAQLWTDQIKRLSVVLWARCFIWVNVHWAVWSVSFYPTPCRSHMLHWGRAPLQLADNYKMVLERGGYCFSIASVILFMLTS